MAIVQPEPSWIVYARSDFPHLFLFRFSKEDMDHIVQNWPGSNLDGLVRVWPNTSGLEASWGAGIIRPSFWQDATGPLPVSHFETWFHSSTDGPENIVQNQPGYDLVLADCASGLGQTDLVWKQAYVQESSGPLLANASQPIWTGSELDPACFLGMKAPYNTFIKCFSQFSNMWHAAHYVDFNCLSTCSPISLSPCVM